MKESSSIDSALWIYYNIFWVYLMGIWYGLSCEPLTTVHLWDWNIGRSLLKTDLDWFRVLCFLVWWLFCCIDNISKSKSELVQAQFQFVLLFFFFWRSFSLNVLIKLYKIVFIKKEYIAYNTINFLSKMSCSFNTLFQKGDINVWQFDWGSYPQEFVQIAFYINQASLCKSRVSPLMVSHTYGTKLTFTAEKLSEAFLVKEFNW